MSENLTEVMILGRIVAGSLYNSRDKDMDGDAILDKDGQPAEEWYVGVAVPKTPGKAHWAYEEWGAKVYAVGAAAFPNIYTDPSFSWKITDGDSNVKTRKGQGTAPNTREGHPGHWIVNLSTRYPFKIVNADGSAFILEKDVVMPGDLVEVLLNVKGNGSQKNPGTYLNTQFVAFVGHSPLGRISLGRDPKSAGFGKGPRPQTVAAPIGGMTPPVAPAAPLAAPPALAAPLAAPPLPGLPAPPAAPLPAPVGVAPAPSYLAAPAAPPAPPAPPAGPVRTMIGQAAANGWTYETLIGQGWKDADLLAQGLMRVG